MDRLISHIHKNHSIDVNKAKNAVYLILWFFIKEGPAKEMKLFLSKVPEAAKIAHSINPPPPIEDMPHEVNSFISMTIGLVNQDLTQVQAAEIIRETCEYIKNTVGINQYNNIVRFLDNKKSLI